MALYLDTPIQYIKGIGPKLGEAFRRKGLLYVGDLLQYFPRGYEDRRTARQIATLEAGETVCLKATVTSVQSIPLGRRGGRRLWTVTVHDESGKISCKYFRVPYKGYFERFQPHQKVWVIGKVDDYRGQREFHHPDLKPCEEGEKLEEEGLIPLYTEIPGVSSQKLRRTIQICFEQLVEGDSPLKDPLSSRLREKYELVSLEKAYRALHIPEMERARQYREFRSPAQRRIIFEEFFWLEFLLGCKRQGVQRKHAHPIEKDYTQVKQLVQNLPFELTEGQRKAFAQIAASMSQAHPMHRLLQGDVGSGKTLVALMAAGLAATAGVQTAFMVPTEVLAQQHYETAKKLFELLGWKVVLLTGSTSKEQRMAILEQLRAGQAVLCIGTHALIQEVVEFRKLGLVIIDEQHRFGVHQRSQLQQKGMSPHFLVMTATPIPRSLAMTVYGDLDVSVIRERPKGRQPIETKTVYSGRRSKVWGFVRDQLEKGRQAYVIYPLVEESEKMDLRDAISHYEELRDLLKPYQVGLLHGRMKPAEKDEVMTQFRQNQVQVLVSTTVVEVGVDVPNANLILIEHPERFGLSQLHQLRGRVGRGEHKSYCLLLAGERLSQEARQRLQIMVEHTDGFRISEADLELRGPGEFLGTKQSGLPGFRMAHLLRDMEILMEAREAVKWLLQEDPELQQPGSRTMRDHLWGEHKGLAEKYLG